MQVACNCILAFLQQNRGHDDDDLVEREILEQIEQLFDYSAYMLMNFVRTMLESRTKGRQFSPLPVTDLESLFMYKCN
jgi:hypothetical protein